MCNEAARRISLNQLREDWSELKIPLRFPEGLPNMAPLDSIKITDPSVIIRAAADAPGEADAVTRRWSWPAPTGKPVYNYRSDNREFRSGRCLIPIDGFYEFTDAPVADGEAPKKRAPKSKWEFRMKGLDWFCVAGLWRTDPKVGEAWTMLTTEPGPDIAPYHDRQIVLLGPQDYGRWLDPAVPARELCRPLSEGTLEVKQVR
ncbi:SOS response-associated peptidase family protein [Sphingomonas sp. ASY06-1R]|uniref:SOS response-associated peptidase family protein n=1 Tax=Sphingomonas sp. ASY06-1R TaxID=3445771 RepID=UPI003FA1B506